MYISIWFLSFLDEPTLIKNVSHFCGSENNFELEKHALFDLDYDSLSRVVLQDSLAYGKTMKLFGICEENILGCWKAIKRGSNWRKFTFVIFVRKPEKYLDMVLPKASLHVLKCIYAKLADIDTIKEIVDRKRLALASVFFSRHSKWEFTSRLSLHVRGCSWDDGITDHTTCWCR